MEGVLLLFGLGAGLQHPAVYHDRMIVPQRLTLRTVAAIISLCVVISLFAFRTPILRAAGWALVADDPLGTADVIVVPQWVGEAGALEAADLVRAGVAPRVAVLVGSPSPADEELTRRRILSRDVDTWLTRLIRSLGVATVEEISNPLNGTEAEGLLLPEWSDLRGFHSIVVVSTSDHSRRVRRVLHRSMKGHDTTIIVRQAHYSQFAPDRWWETRDGTRTEIVELQKLLFDIIRHPISIISP